MKDYELLDHTADLGIRVRGKSLHQLFATAASAMFELITDISKVNTKKSISIELESDDKDSLLKDWLTELLYYCNVKNILLREFKIEEIGERFIKADAKGEAIDKKKHRLNREIKAVTFHGLSIQQQEGLFTTEIIFDV